MAKPKQPKTPEMRVLDQASVEMLKKAETDGLGTAFSRMDTQDVQCKFGSQGLCCRVCHMGPCRITAKTPLGVCGADAHTIVARNYLREVVGGAAAHSDHARGLALLLKKVAQGLEGGYQIRDEKALRRNAAAYGVKELDRGKEAIAIDLADRLLEEFTSQESTLKGLTLAPLNRQGVWRKHGVEPLGIDRMMVESMHRSTMGVDHDHRHLLQQAMRTALADGWGGSRVASIISDILFGTPQPVRGDVNLGVLGEHTVNIVVHGHEPVLSEMLAVAVRDSEIETAAVQAGAEGVTLAGVCCTANEILMRHGIPVAGNFLQQELAIITGAVEMMVVDVQCCMPSLPEVAAAYHTEIVSTSAIASTVGATPLPFAEDRAYDDAKALVRRAIANYANRDRAKMAIPEHRRPLIGGFSVDAIKYMLGGTFRASFRPLNDAIMQGRITGVCGVVGCSNPKIQMDSYTNALTRELLRNNVLVLKTGCAAIASAKAGLLLPEAGFSDAGPGLREVCEAVGMPPVLHMGSCVDNSRILEAATEMVREGGLGEDLSDIPAVGVAPEWMSEKAITIGCYFVASGIDVVLGHPFHIEGSDQVTGFLNNGARALYGASFHVEPDPLAAAEVVLEILNRRRDKLGINTKAERKLMDMKDRRQIHVEADLR
jgi:carbon-monoxide dehydrogenase catalytic subunit